MMEHLRSQFFDELTEESNTYVEQGRVYIRSRNWSPEDVLTGLLTPEAFEDVFGDWLQERFETKLSDADDILSRFGLADRFGILAEAHERGSVTPFVGAGLSVPSGYPGWTAFLRTLRKQTTVPEADLEALLQAGNYEEAAEVLANSLGPAFNEAVESSFGCKRELNGVVRYLPYVFSGPVITTNFDDVVKRAQDQAERAFEETISATQTEEVARVIAAGRHVQIKIHGTARTGQGRVLTRSEYETHYSDARILEDVIRALCGRILLFLGCSLCVDRTLTVMRDYVQERGHDNVARHYAFLEDPGSDELRASRRDELVECNIYPVWYPQDEHDASIEALLTKLRGSPE